MAGRLAGKIAIVTGAGRGIGEAIARCFAGEGAAVTIAEKNPDTGAATARSIVENGGRAHFVATDVTSPEDVERAVAETVAEFGPPTTLVNNAGTNVFHEPLAMSDGEWQRCFRLDLDSAWTCSKAVLPLMLKAGSGGIINIASTHSFKIIRHTFPYPVAKHALLGMTRALGIEYADRGIRVNAIAPGYIETQIAVDYWNSFPDPAAERQRTYDLQPPKRIGRPEDVAWTAVFLASDEAPFINAECIMVDGGRSVVFHD
jgi:NAD(P)-dependent dehydrogenase (short-subunit alcohol dehydrogenase family)